MDGRMDAVAGAAAEHPDDVDDEELQLLQLLQNIPYSSMASDHSSSSGPSTASGSPSPPAVACDADHETLSPPDDIMHYFRHILSLPPFPGADSITLPELAADYSSTVHSLALQLHLVDGPPGLVQCEPSPRQRIKLLIDRHLHLIASLVLQQRAELMEQFMLTNFDTMQSLEEQPVDRYVWLLQQLGLSQHQEAAIGHGMSLFTRLLQPLIAERQQLQQQIAAEKVRQQMSHKQLLEVQGNRLFRLSVVLRKEYLTRFAAALWMVGSLSYAQLAKIAVPMSPYPARFSTLGKLLHEKFQQQRGSSTAATSQRQSSVSSQH